MRVLDLFSGIGGFSLGLERAGMETVGFCENDKKAQLVLKKHWPGVTIFNDVRELNAEQLKHLYPIDLICGGFPCQPFSQAGKQRGDQDDRHLWPEYFRLIQELKPRWVIGENVAGLINLGLDQVLSDLESANYSCQTLIIPACAINAPHRRDRVWIIAHNEEPFNREYSSEQNQRQKPEPGESSIHANVAHTQRERAGNVSKNHRETGRKVNTPHYPGGAGGEPNKPVDRETMAYPPKHSSYGLRKTRAPRSRQEVGGCHSEPSPSFWSIEPDVGRVAHGVPRRVDRLKQLGNAVVPQIVEIIGRAIMAIENDQ